MTIRNEMSPHVNMPQKDWQLLKFAVLGASCNNPEYYEALPENLKNHEVARLVKSHLDQGGKKGALLDKAANLLVPDCDNAWLVLMK